MPTLLKRGNALVPYLPGALMVGLPWLEITAPWIGGSLPKMASFPVSRVVLEEKISRLIHSKESHLGGHGLLVALILRALSPRVAFIGKIGLDYEALVVRSILRQVQVTPWLLVDDHHPTAKVLALYAEGRRIEEWIDYGASTQLSLEELSGFEMQRMGIIHFDAHYLDQPWGGTWLARAKRSGGYTSLKLEDPAWIASRRTALQSWIDGGLDMLVGTYDSYAAWTGHNTPQRLLRALAQQIRWAAIFESHQIACCANDRVWVRQLPVPLDLTHPKEVALITAGILHGLRMSWSIEQGLRLAAELLTECKELSLEGSDLPAWQKFSSRHQ